MALSPEMKIELLLRHTPEEVARTVTGVMQTRWAYGPHLGRAGTVEEHREFAVEGARDVVSSLMPEHEERAREIYGLLGWPRSKVKRIEKHETASISKDDLAALRSALKMDRVVRVESARRKADFGKPKPRLDYEEGMDRVLEFVREEAGRGNLWLSRGEIEEATGYTAVQVRTFCKALEREGDLERRGRYRGMLYGLATGAKKRKTPRPEVVVVEEPPTVVEQIREAVHFPAWLMSVVEEHDLGALTVSEIWGK